MSGLPDAYEIVFDKKRFREVNQLLKQGGDPAVSHARRLVDIVEAAESRETSAKGIWMYQGVRSRRRIRRASFLLRQFVRFQAGRPSDRPSSQDVSIELTNALETALVSTEDVFIESYCVEALSSLAWTHPNMVAAQVDVSAVAEAAVDLVDSPNGGVSRQVVLYLLAVFSTVARDALQASDKLYEFLNGTIGSSQSVVQSLAEYVLSQLPASTAKSRVPSAPREKRLIFDNVVDRVRAEPAADAVIAAQSLGLLAAVDELSIRPGIQTEVPLETVRAVSAPSREAVAAKIGLAIANRESLGTIVAGDDPRSGSPLVVPPATPSPPSVSPTDSHERDMDSLVADLRENSSAGTSFLATLLGFRPDDLVILRYERVYGNQFGDVYGLKSKYFLRVKRDVKSLPAIEKSNEGDSIEGSVSNHPNIDYVTMQSGADCIGLNGLFEFLYKADDEDLHLVSEALGELTLRIAGQVDLEYEPLAEAVRASEGRNRSKLTRTLGMVAATGYFDSFDATELGRLMGCAQPTERRLAATALNEATRLGVSSVSDISSALSPGDGGEFNPSLFLQISDGIAREVLELLTGLRPCLVPKSEQVRRDVERFLRRADWGMETRLAAVEYLAGCSTESSGFDT